MATPGRLSLQRQFRKGSGDGNHSRTNHLGAAPATAILRANGGRLVNGGLKQQPNGHVVIVVKSTSLQYPAAYWGRLGHIGRKNTTINWSWNSMDRPLVHYFSANP